ncbi:hypothetical protein HPB52_025635 [Rhipicephalus sanguineus]|uniref:Uncharacterized protein n=1 Tax=Rhipicephalus sanguineus TaxID=34632 RepID=A0A9D4TCU3_RHISA|nr:hypothetical protein HPB52_025635 [Rhipicephalus sanguineus]
MKMPPCTCPHGARSWSREDALAWSDVSVREANICRRDPVERQRPRDLARTRLLPSRPADAEEPATFRLALLKQDPERSHDRQVKAQDDEAAPKTCKHAHLGVFTHHEDASLHVPAWREEKKKRRKGTGHVDRPDGARSWSREDALAWSDVSVREANICRRDPVERQRPRDLARTRLLPSRPADAEEPATFRLALLKQDPERSHDRQVKARTVSVAFP